MFPNSFLVILVTFFLLSTGKSQKTCIPGSFRTGTTCKICPPGTFSSGYNRLSCKKCPKGTFRTKPGAKSKRQCLVCAAGTASNVLGAASCKPCPPGQDSNPGFSSCVRCRAGFALSPEGSSGCTKCGQGTFAPKRGTKVCLNCPEGTSSKSGSRGCEKCPPGTFRSDLSFHSFTPGRGSCLPCPAGSFSEKFASRWCGRCPPGTFSGRGASECTPCPQNMFNNRIPARRCQACPTGTTTAGIGAALCKDPVKGCPLGTFEDKRGVCRSCLPGERLDSRRRACVPCEENDISEGGDATLCKKCPSGKVPLGDLSFMEKFKCVCPPGTVERIGIGCIPCPAGTFWTETLFKDRRTAREIFPSCDECPAGTFSDKPGSFDCKKCAANTFAEAGQSSCQRCPPGTKSPRLASFTAGVDTERGLCVNEETGCAAGEIMTTKGRCRLDSCPSKNQFLGRNSFFKTNACQECFGNFRLRIKASGLGECVPCKDDEFGLEGASKTCTKCPRGQTPNFEDRLSLAPRCSCKNNKYMLDGRCVTRCPSGWAGQLIFRPNSGRSVDSLLFDMCARCADFGARIIALRSGKSCVECPKDSIAVNATKCKRCPKGQVVGRDLFGGLTNFCQLK